MTTDEAMTAYTQLSEIMVLLSKRNTVTLYKADLDWLAQIHLLLPELPLEARDPSGSRGEPDGVRQVGQRPVEATSGTHATTNVCYEEGHEKH
jgi:hypothetical protein